MIRYPLPQSSDERMLQYLGIICKYVIHDYFYTIRQKCERMHGTSLWKKRYCKVIIKWSIWPQFTWFRSNNGGVDHKTRYSWPRSSKNSCGLHSVKGNFHTWQPILWSPTIYLVVFRFWLTTIIQSSIWLLRHANTSLSGKCLICWRLREFTASPNKLSLLDCLTRVWRRL